MIFNFINIKNNRALTLIEILMALTIFAIGALGIISLYPVGLSASKTAANLSEVTFLAQWLIEDIKNQTYAAVNTVAASTSFPQNSDFSYTYIVTEPIANALKHVNITVTWNRKGTVKSQTYITQVANME